jgi:tetratricopeptide (TPR) repeat protein/O-antigen ligase
MNSKIVNFLFYTIIIVSPLVFFTDLTRNPYYFQIIFAQSGMVLIWILILLKQKGEIYHYTNPFEKPMLIFYFWAVITWIISLLFLDHNYHVPQLLEYSREIYKKNYLFMSMFNEGFKKLLFTITNILLVYFFATNYVNEKNFSKIYYTFFIVGFLASVYGILQYFGIELIWPKVLNPFGGRCVSTFGNPNFLSTFLILLFPLMFVEYLVGKNTVIMFVFMITYFCALLSTLTRSSWAGLVASFIYFCFMFVYIDKKVLVKNFKKLLIIFVSLTILFFIWPKSPIGGNPAPAGRITELQLAKEVYGPLHQRFLIWLCGWDMVKEKFFTGKGWGLFELFYPFYQGKYLFIKKLSHRTHANNAHNEIIEVWSQTGTIGLGLYILFITMFFIYSYKLAKIQQDDYKKMLVVGLSSSVLAMLVDNLLNVTIHFCVPAFLYFFNLGVLPTFDFTREQKKVKLSNFIVVLIVIIGVFIMIRLWLNFLGEINYFKGFKYSKRNELQPALYYLSKANKFQRYEVNNNYELANTYARLKKLDEAIYYYYEALASNCGYDEIHFNLATVLMQKQDFQQAKLHYTQSLFINPLSKDAYAALGSLFLTNTEENLEPAIKLYEQAVKVFPNEKDFYNNLGFLYIKIGQDYKALECYQKALQIDPNFEYARRNYSILAKKLGIKNDVVSFYNLSLQQIIKDVEQKNFDAAEQKCYNLLKVFPNDVTTKFYLANIYFSKGLVEEAVKIYQQLLELQPDNLNIRYNLAIALIKQKNFDEAEQHLNYILSKQPNNNLVKEQLNIIQQMKNF